MKTGVEKARAKEEKRHPSSSSHTHKEINEKGKSLDLPCPHMSTCAHTSSQMYVQKEVVVVVMMMGVRLPNNSENARTTSLMPKLLRNTHFDR